MKIRAFARVLALSLATAGPAIAEPVAEPGSDAVVAEIVVKGEAPPRSASETRRDRRVIEAAPHHTASDVLLTVPGVYVSQHSGEGKAHQIFYRGFDAVHGQDLEISVAGAPVNEVSNVHGQGYADLHFVMPEVIESVVARPGSYDPRQGDFAVAGSVELELGYAEQGVTAKAGLGSFGARRTFVAYHPAGAPEATFAAAELQSTDGYGQGRAANRGSAIGQVELALGGGYRARLMASSYAGRFGSAGVLRLDDIDSGRMGRFDSYDTDQGGRSQRTQLVTTVARVAEGFDFGVAPYFVRRSLILRSNYTGYLDNEVLGDSTQQINEASTLGARAWYKRRLRLFSESDSVEVGASMRSDWVAQSQRRLSSSDDSVTRTELDADVRAADIGAYLDFELHPIRRVRLRGGLRADELSFSAVDRGENGGSARTSQGTHLGKKGTVEVGIVQGVSAVASYGEGFRSPQARSLGDGEKTPFTEVTSMEAGLRMNDGERVRFATSVYRTALDQDLVFDEATSRNLPAPGSVRLGWVADFVAEPADWFTSALGVTYTRAEFSESGGRYQEGELVPFVPQVVVRTDLSVKRALRQFGKRGLTGRAGVATTFVYRRPLPYAEFGSDVMVVDAQAGARFGEFELLGEAFNLFDHDYYDGEFVYSSNFERGAVASQIPVRHVTAGAPRSFFVSLAVYL
jgi:iron complex outermembrane receptor protein